MSDLIDRQAAINIVVCDILSSAIVYGRTEEGMTARKAIVDGLKRLPPVKPAEKVGQWKWVQYYCDRILGDWVCSKCKSVAVEGVMKYNEEAKPTYKYCPQCGCKMQEGKE